MQILVHGFTLTHAYWDFPYGGGRYSYVDAASARGYATFAIDRIGVGNSSKPPALSVTLSSNVHTLHQVVAAVRSGSVTGEPVSTVVLVGHSFGAAISATEAGRYRDVDGVVVTSFLHVPGAGAAKLIGSVYPAQFDQKFANVNLPLGYVTTRPGTRSQFYVPSDTDPAVIRVHEQAKGTGTVGELATFAPYFSPLSPTQHVNVPVLLAIGEDDPYFCQLPTPCPNAAAVVGRESLYFGPDAQMTGYVLPGAGHNIALELNSGQAAATILDWVDDVLER